MRALKVLVVVLGVLLVGGTAALIGAIVERAGQRAAAAPKTGFDRTVIDLPEGARVVSTDVTGNLLLVRLALAAGGEELVLIDAGSGERRGIVVLRPAAGGGR